MSFDWIALIFWIIFAGIFFAVIYLIADRYKNRINKFFENKELKQATELENFKKNLQKLEEEKIQELKAVNENLHQQPDVALPTAKLIKSWETQAGILGSVEFAFSAKTEQAAVEGLSQVMNMSAQHDELNLLLAKKTEKNKRTDLI